MMSHWPIEVGGLRWLCEFHYWIVIMNSPKTFVKMVLDISNGGGACSNRISTDSIRIKFNVYTMVVSIPKHVLLVQNFINMQRSRLLWRRRMFVEKSTSFYLPPDFKKQLGIKAVCIRTQGHLAMLLRKRSHCSSFLGLLDLLKCHGWHKASGNGTRTC